MIKLKTLTLLCSLSLMVSTVSAQETKKVTRKEKVNYLNIKETFEVLKSDPEVKHGSYTLSFSGYSENGQYDQGKKTGIWECYNRGKLVHKYDFSTGLFSEETAPKMVVKITMLDDQGNAVKALTPRNIYLGGDAKMISVLVQSIRYPATAQQKNTQGKVHITALLSKDGKLIGEKAETNIGDGLEEEALRVFRLYPADWVPVIEDGKPVSVKVELLIGFSLA